MKKALWISLAALALALYVFPLTRHFALLDPDEGLHAAISQEMLERGDLVTPRFLGEPFPDKPILFFWSQVLALAVFGEHEAATRLPGLVFGALGAWTTGLLAAALFGARDRRARWMAAGFYATLVMPMALMQAPVHDVALVPWTNLALLALWKAAHADAPRITMQQSLLAGVWIGLAILTKGFAGVALVGIAHLALLLVERRLTPGVIAGGMIALAAGVVIASPWYLAMEHAQPGYLRYYLIERHVEGFTSETQRHAHRPWFYYLGVLAVGGLPWILYVPFARWRTGMSIRLRRDPTTRVTPDGEVAGPDAAARLGWCWLMTSLLFLSVAGSKLFTYALPLFPAIALLAAVTWTRWLDVRAGLKPGPSNARLEEPPGFDPAGARRHADRSERPGFSPAVAPAIRRTVTLHGVVAAALLPAVLLTAQWASPWRAASWLWVACIPIAIAQLFAARRARSGAFRTAVITSAWAQAAIIVVALTFVLPPVADWFSARDVALAINERGRFPSELWMLKERPGSVVFYLSPELRRGLTPERLRQVTPYELLRLDVPPGAIVAVEDDDVPRVRSFTPLAQLTYERAGHFRLYDPLLFRQPRGQPPQPDSGFGQSSAAIEAGDTFARNGPGLRARSEAKVRRHR